MASPSAQGNTAAAARENPSQPKKGVRFRERFRRLQCLGGPCLPRPLFRAGSTRAQAFSKARGRAPGTSLRQRSRASALVRGASGVEISSTYPRIAAVRATVLLTHSGHNRSTSRRENRGDVPTCSRADRDQTATGSSQCPVRRNSRSFASDGETATLSVLLGSQGRIVSCTRWARTLLVISCRTRSGDGFLGGTVCNHRICRSKETGLAGAVNDEVQKP
jgi:hypothetical protein